MENTKKLTDDQATKMLNEIRKHVNLNHSEGVESLDSGARIMIDGIDATDSLMKAIEFYIDNQ